MLACRLADCSVTLSKLKLGPCTFGNFSLHQIVVYNYSSGTSNVMAAEAGISYIICLMF